MILATPSLAETRLALVVGNADYENVPSLDTPVDDARAVAEKLRSLDFEVIEALDANRGELQAAIRRFGETAENFDVGLFYYAGHAIQYGGVNYVVPTDALLQTQEDIGFELVDVNQIMQQLRDRTSTRLMFLDACRDNPFADLPSTARANPNLGLAPVAASRGTYIAYATEPNNVAFDSLGADHSPFTNALLRHIDTAGVEVRLMMNKVRAEVVETTSSRQVPWDHSSLLGEFYFNGGSSDSTGDDLASLNRLLAIADPDERLAALEAFSAEHADSALDPIIDTTISALAQQPQPGAVPGFNRPPLVADATELLVEADVIAQPLQIPAPRDPDNDALQISVMELPLAGTMRAAGRQIKLGDVLTVEQLGDSVYHLPGDLVGDAGKFAFRVADGRGGSAVGMVPIRILQANNPPVMDLPAALAATVGGAPIAIAAQPPSDPDPDDQVIVRFTRVPATGELGLDGVMLAAGHAVTAEQLQRTTYTPPAIFSTGADRIELIAEDGRGGKTVKQIAIGFNRPPAFGEDTTVTAPSSNEDVTLDLDPPSDPDGDHLTIAVQSVQMGAGGVYLDDAPLERGMTLELDQLSELVYRPDGNFAGYAGRVILEAQDHRGGIARKTVTVRIDRPNRVPMLAAAHQNVTAIVGQSLPLRIAQPFDPDGHELQVLVTAVPANGVIELDEEIIREHKVLTPAELTRLQFEADAAAVGSVGTLRYTVQDSRGGTVAGALDVLIEAANQPPVASNHEITTSSDRPPATLIATPPWDPDGDELDIEIMTLPTIGKVQVDGRELQPGDRISAADVPRLTFSVADLFVGSAGSLEYLVTDSRGGEARARTDVFIEPPNRAPVAYTQPPISAQQGSAVPLALRRPFDPDQDELRIVVTDIPTRGKVVAGDRELTLGDRLALFELDELAFRPGDAPPGAVGRFAYRVVDQQESEASGSVDLTIERANQSPLVDAQSEIIATAGGEPVLLLPNGPPADPDGDDLRITVLNVPGAGEILIDGEAIERGDRLDSEALAKVAYQADSDFVGAAGLFRFRVDDGHGAQAVAEIRLYVEPANRPPVAASNFAYDIIAGAPSTALPIDAPFDPDGDPLVAAVAVLPPIEGLEVATADGPIVLGDLLTASDLRALSVAAPRSAAGQTGTIGLEVRDGRGGTAAIEVDLDILAPENRPPVVIFPGPVELAEGGGPQALGLEEPVDRDGDTLTVTLTALPAQGVTVLRGAQLEADAELLPSDLPALQFDPGEASPGYLGTLEILATDSQGASASGVVPIRVAESPNRPPVIPPASAFDAVVGVGTVPMTIDLPLDPDGDQLIIRISQVPDNGVLAFNNRPAVAEMALTLEEFAKAMFTPVAERVVTRGTTSQLRYIADDGQGGVSEGSVQVRTVIHDCDRLASATENIDSVAPGVAFEQIAPAKAIEACDRGLADYGNIVRFRFQLARAQHAAGQYPVALDTYFMAALAGDAAAQNNLGLLLIDPPAGIDERGDVKVGLTWLRRASEAGFVPAQRNLAAMIWRLAAEGSADVEPKEAETWLLEAGNQGDPAALTDLAMAYVEGRPGVAPDVEQAIRLLRRAASQDYAPAQTNLGYLYAQGLAGQTDYGEAERWFETSAAKGDLLAMFNLGTLYSERRSGSEDLTRSLKAYANVACTPGSELGTLAVRHIDELDESEATTAAQGLLAAKGYQPGPVDGRFGPSTQRALEQYQSDQGLAITGAISAEVLLALADCKR